jgi:taurine dioxygenase
MFELYPITGTFGAEVGGINLAEDFGPDTAEKLREAFVEHKVLVFRDQVKLTATSFAEFARTFGEIERHPFYKSVPDVPEVSILDTNTNGVRAQDGWHSDMTFYEVPPLGTVLRAIDIPPYGRDTAFADMEAVYAGLSETFREMLEDLNAVHDWRHMAAFDKRARELGRLEQLQEELQPSTHPVVRTHPVTGRRSIFVNSVWTRQIVGMHPDESAWLLRMLYDQVRYPEYQLRVRWAPGTVTMWDNRSVQHALVFDREWPRVMERVQVLDNEPPR